MTPFQRETVWSYVTRLAHANHLQPQDLRSYLVGRQHADPRPDWLATASGYPLQVLHARLKGLAADERDPTRQRRRSRPACQLCMARRGVHQQVYCWLPEYMTVCRRHQRWIGPPARAWEDQQSLAARPRVIAAARTHGRLCHISTTAEHDLRDGQRIVKWWARQRIVLDARSDIDTLEAHISAYPQVITLAQILGAYRRRLWHYDGKAVTLARTIHDLHNEIAHQLNIRHPHAEMHPIEGWIYDQRIVARTRITASAVLGNTASTMREAN